MGYILNLRYKFGYLEFRIHSPPQWLPIGYSIISYKYLQDRMGHSRYLWDYWASLVAQMVKNLFAIQETQVWLRCVGNIFWRGECLPTPVFVSGENQGQRSLVGYSPRGHKEGDMTEHLSIQRIISLALLLSPGNVRCALWLLVSCHFLPNLDQSDDPKQILGPVMDSWPEILKFRA